MCRRHASGGREGGVETNAKLVGSRFVDSVFVPLLFALPSRTCYPSTAYIGFLVGAKRNADGGVGFGGVV